jgi:protein gp37
MFSFASVEPMLGPIDARLHMPKWVICGGESGKNARPLYPLWARDLRDQCATNGVPFHFKQWGEWRFAPDLPDHVEGAPAFKRIGKKAAGRLLDGIEHNGFPSGLTL